MALRSPVHPRLWPHLATVLALAAALTLAPAAWAQAAEGDSAIVQVTADVVVPQALSLTLCDPTADFGSGLSPFGTPPTEGPLSVATSPGDPALSQGVYYRWTPSCQNPTGKFQPFLTIQATIPWLLTVCAGESTGTSPTLKIANRDLLWYPDALATYNEVLERAFPFESCAAPMPMSGGGNVTMPVHYYLQIDPTDLGGTFNAATTWTVTP